MKKKLEKHNLQISWLRFEQEIPSELEDSFYWFLDNLGINRFSFEYSPESNSTMKLFIWLPFNEWSERDKKNLVQSLDLLAKTFEKILKPCKWIQVKDEDWSSVWKQNWKPDLIGNSILILPAWLEAPKEFTEKKIIRIDPGFAFGTGSHPSTRLCIEALDNDPPIGKTIADLGCGSGILSLVALKLGAKSIFAVDTDSLAISATKLNFSINNLPKRSLNVYKGSIEQLVVNIPEEKIDLMLCNILAPVIKSLGSDFYRIIGEKGKVILSGLLIEQSKEIQEFFSSIGWEMLDLKTKDNWASMIITRSFLD